MLPDERDAAYLWDMLDAARDICEFTKGMDSDKYLRDSITQAAVERKAGIIGDSNSAGLKKKEVKKAKKCDKQTI
jgi:uncharacterized protein with HEPN domain